jgi:hypothetical protein
MRTCQQSNHRSCQRSYRPIPGHMNRRHAGDQPATCNQSSMKLLICVMHGHAIKINLATAAGIAHLARPFLWVLTILSPRDVDPRRDFNKLPIKRRTRVSKAWLLSSCTLHALRAHGLTVSAAGQLRQPSACIYNAAVGAVDPSRPILSVLCDAVAVHHHVPVCMFPS